MRSVHNEYLNHRFELSDEPMRVVSLVSSATEAMSQMGLLDRVVGVSEYCERYAEVGHLPIVGQYLAADSELIQSLQPDLVLLTTGVQRGLSMKLAAAGLPVYNLPLPYSFEGILENIRLLGGLLNTLSSADTLMEKMREAANQLRQEEAGRSKVKVYVELWLGRHLRAVGGLSYIRDLVELAGGEMIFGTRPEGYFVPEMEEVRELSPEIYVCFHEPEYLINGEERARECGLGNVKVIMSTVKCGENMIQDGPSLLETARWLRGRIEEELR